MTMESSLPTLLRLTEPQLQELDKFQMQFGSYEPPADVVKGVENDIMYTQYGWFTTQPAQLKNVLDLLFKDRTGDVWKCGSRAEMMASMIAEGKVPNPVRRIQQFNEPSQKDASARILKALH